VEHSHIGDINLGNYGLGANLLHGSEGEKDKKNTSPLFFGVGTIILDAAKQPSIVNQLRRSTAMYVHTGELLGQPSPESAGPQLPDWARLYLKSVRANSLKNLKPYESLFEIITFHPTPWQADLLRRASDQFERAFVLESDPLRKQFLLELGRIRDARLYQDRNYKQLHENHRKLFRDVVMSFKTFEAKDLEPFLVEALLALGAPFVFPRQGLWNLGRRFVREKLPKGLSTRVAESELYMQDPLFARLGGELYRTALKLQNENANFKKKVETEKKARAKRP
jgi:uncharacterized membrane protein YfbV (UPF0208 family)